MTRRNNIMAAMAIVLLIASTAQAATQSPESVLEKAFQAYSDSQYAEAAKLFESLVDFGIHNGRLYVDIGTSWMKAGDAGRSLLWLERAQWLDPQDPDVSLALEKARRLAGVDGGRGQGGLEKNLLVWRNVLSLEYAAWIAVILMSMFWATLFLAGRYNRLSTVLAAVALIPALWLVSGVSWELGLGPERAVVLVQDTAMRSGYTDSATALDRLEAGTLVEIKKTGKGHYLVRGPGGSTGWVDQEEIGLIRH